MPSNRDIKRLTSGITTLIFVLLALFATTPPGRKIFSNVAAPGTYHVIKDVDGDTIEVDVGGVKETVRFIGVDTPETHD